MKKVLFFVIATALLIACSKDSLDQQVDGNPISGDIQTRSGNNISVNQGLLHLSSPNEFVDMVELLEADHANLSKREADYLALGMSANFRQGDNRYTEYPSARLFESNLSFESLRRGKELQDFALSDQGIDPDGFIFLLKKRY